jgi:hypothetical protein
MTDSLSMKVDRLERTIESSVQEAEALCRQVEELHDTVQDLYGQLRQHLQGLRVERLESVLMRDPVL